MSEQATRLILRASVERALSVRNGEYPTGVEEMGVEGEKVVYQLRLERQSEDEPALMLAGILESIRELQIDEEAAGQMSGFDEFIAEAA